MSSVSTEHSSENIFSYASCCFLAAWTILIVCLVELYSRSRDDDERSRNNCILFNGFVIYFADNVLTMLVATTAGTLGMTLFGSSGGIGPGGPQLITAQVLGILVNTCIALALYFLAASRYHAANNTGDHESSHAFSHMLQTLPWLIIVPAVNIPYTIYDELVPIFQSDAHKGGLVLALLITTMGFGCLVLVTSFSYSNRPDMGSRCESLPTFLLNSLNHSLLSCTGKSLHLVEYEIRGLLTGPGGRGDLASDLSSIIIMLIITWFFLAHAWPRLSVTTPDDKIFKSTITTVTVYAWAFSFISDLWDYFYYGVASGQLYYWAIMIVCLLVALLVAYTSSNNFYGGPSPTGAAFGLMLCWTIDFGVWWAWSQVMTDIDNAVDPDGGVFRLGLANGAIMLGLLVVTSLIYRYGEPRSMLAARAGRVQHDLSLSEALASSK